MSRIRPKQPRLQLDPESYEQLCREVLQRTDGDLSSAAAWRVFRFVTGNFGLNPEMTPSRT